MKNIKCKNKPTLAKAISKFNESNSSRSARLRSAP